MVEAAILISAFGAATAAFLLVRMVASTWVVETGGSVIAGARQFTSRVRSLIETAAFDGRLPDRSSHRRMTAIVAVAGIIAGFTIAGLIGAAAAAIPAPFATRAFLAARRRRYARRIDQGATELALALVSAFSAGRSVRGALLTAGSAVPAPMADELERLAVDLTLGQSIEDALAALRSRTGSTRIESIVGAIELHQRCGGDLAELLRDLAAAFRARDLAGRDAHASTAQARFTAILVAAMPISAAVLAEVGMPGSVSGAFAFAPTALLMFCAIGLFAIGATLCLKVSRL